MYVIDNVIIGIVHVFFQNSDIQFVEFRVICLVFLTLHQKGLQIIKIFFFQLAFLTINDTLSFVHYLILVDVDQLSVISDLLVLQFVEIE